MRLTKSPSAQDEGEDFETGFQLRSGVAAAMTHARTGTKGEVLIVNNLSRLAAWLDELGMASCAVG
jgi:hypothetical protein